MQAVQGLVIQRGRSRSFSQMASRSYWPRSVLAVGVFVQMLLALFALQVLDGAAGHQLHRRSGCVEKFRNLQPYMMGGQAERMWTSFAPLS